MQSVGNLRFFAGCRLGLLPALELKSRLSAGRDVTVSSVSELVAELCTTSLGDTRGCSIVVFVLYVGLKTCGRR